MGLEGLTPRIVVAIGLVAILPVAVYGIGRSPEAAFMAAINVVLVIAALFLAMGPVAASEAGHA